MTINRKRKAVSFLATGGREVGVAEFKTHCLEIMDDIEQLGVQVVITKHRRPVARLVPYISASGAFCGSLKDIHVNERDIVAPTGGDWAADESNLA